MNSPSYMIQLPSFVSFNQYNCLLNKYGICAGTWNWRLYPGSQSSHRLQNKGELLKKIIEDIWDEMLSCSFEFYNIETKPHNLTEN